MEDVEVTLEQLVEMINQHHSSLTSEIPFEPKCLACGDDGWILHEDGDYKSVEKCRCLVLKEATRRIRNSGLSRVLDAWNMDAFTTGEGFQARMKDTAVRYVDAVKSGEKPWLFVGGAVGSGKSHLCTAVSGELLKDRFNVRYFQWLTDARRMKGLASDPDDYDSLLGRYSRVDVLYIDDLFKSRHNDQYGLNPSDADVRLAFELINSRYVEDKMLIISSEWLLTQELMSIDEGTFSRVYEKTKGYRLEISRGAGRNYRIGGAP